MVSIVMGSDSDLHVMQESANILSALEIPYSMKIVSAHRTPDVLFNFSKNAKKAGVKVIIAGAGGAAHLPGMVASLTSIPVIGIPIKTKTLNGLDSLYSIVQMPGGVPVATVAIDGGLNAGLLAIQMLAINDEEIYKKLENYKNDLKDMVLYKNSKLEN